MSLIKVIGIGSPFGEDRIGWEVINVLKKQRVISKFESNTLTLDCCRLPQLELLDLMEGAEIVFLVDAVQSDGVVGEIYRLENEEIYSISYGISTHSLSIAHVLQLGQILGILPERIILYGIEVGCLSGFNISHKVLEISKNNLLEKLTKEIIDVLGLTPTR
jgi:hydrogenase maturation protease